MWFAEDNKKCVLDVAMSSKRERRLIHILDESHQLGENISAHNNTEIIDNFCKHYPSNLENHGRIDETKGEGKPVEELIDEVIGALDPTNEQYMKVSVVGVVPDRNKMN
tara:strand:+ start:180 stop:506 length:327 start_codon:yes stop_codon:yes gene_type:complete